MLDVSVLVLIKIFAMFNMHSQLKHMISVNSLTLQEIDNLFSLADKAKSGGLINRCLDKIVAYCFFESSTRTFLSFSVALHKLGAASIGFSNIKNSSFFNKGESFEDTVRVLSCYSDAIIVRHSSSDSVINAVNFSSVPIINAGNGIEEHPTQALLDLYTIKEKFGYIDGISVAIVGDLKHSRTVYSLSSILSNYKNITIFYVSSDDLKISEKFVLSLKNKGLTIYHCNSLEDILPLVDVIYMTRLQRERFNSKGVHFNYSVTNKLLSKYARASAIVMHPLPRLNEICTSVDDTRHAWYFKQVKNGVYIRQAILYHVLS